MRTGISRPHGRASEAQGTPWQSSRQRIIVLTFPTADDAAQWDAIGQPLDVLGAETAVVEDPYG